MISTSLQHSYFISYTRYGPFSVLYMHRGIFRFKNAIFPLKPPHIRHVESLQTICLISRQSKNIPRRTVVILKYVTAPNTALEPWSGFSVGKTFVRCWQMFVRYDWNVIGMLPQQEGERKDYPSGGGKDQRNLVNLT